MEDRNEEPVERQEYADLSGRLWIYNEAREGWSHESTEEVYATPELLGEAHGPIQRWWPGLEATPHG